MAIAYFMIKGIIGTRTDVSWNKETCYRYSNVVFFLFISSLFILFLVNFLLLPFCKNILFIHVKHKHIVIHELTNENQYHTQFGPRREKTCLRGFANNTGADQPAHPRSLISAFVIRFWESIICKLASGEISIF